MGKPRVSLGPGDVAGYFSNLKSGFDKIGVVCEHFVLSPNKFSYKENNYFLRFIYLHVVKAQRSENAYLRSLGLLANFSLRVCIFSYAMVRYDTFVFSGIGSFFKFNELPLIKLFGKRVIVVYLGSDARPSYINGRSLDDKGKAFDSEEAKKEVVTQLKLIRRVEKYADVILNHTATAQFFTRDFVRLHAVGMPVRMHDVTLSSSSQARVTRILHAPSRPHAKGSHLFKSAIEILRKEGYEIEYIELVNVENSVVLKELEKCDFLLDELYSDSPMAMLATEAAMFSKPAIVGGYYARQYAIDNPSTTLPPSLFIEPENVLNAIRMLIEDESYRLELGKEANNFVREFWNVKKVAEGYIKIIKKTDIPAEWISRPFNMTYCWGWGLSKENWMRQMEAYITEQGLGGLHLEHNAVLMESIANVVEGGK